MKHLYKVAVAAVLLLMASCTKTEKFADLAQAPEAGVYGIIEPVTSDDPETKATFSPDMKFGFSMGDHINIWSQSGTLLIYSVERLTAGGGAIFEGGGFDLSDGMMYYSSFPLISSFSSDLGAIPVSYEGQVQVADEDANHVAPYSFTYTSSICENGSTHFTYHHYSRWIRFALTLPSNMTVTELTVTADSPVFSLDGTVDVIGGTFTPGRKTDMLTLKLDKVKVSDGVLNAYLAVAPYQACTIVVRVKDSKGKVYTSPVLNQNPATTPGNYRTVTTVLTEDSAASAAVARIGQVTYPTLQAALSTVPQNGTPTTVTMIDDVTIEETNVSEIYPNQDVILDLNGHTISQVGPIDNDSYLLLNRGNLTIMDSSDSAKDGSGTGKMTVDSRDQDTGAPSLYNSHLILNRNVLNIDSGCLELQAATTESDVIFNDTYADTYITGGKLISKVKYAYIARMHLSDPAVNNRLSVSGTPVFQGTSGIMIEYASADANLGELNINGGTFNTTASAVYSLISADIYNVSGINVSITGGTFGGNGVNLRATTPFQNFYVSGGYFTSLDIPAEGAIKFLTGGVFESVSELTAWRTPAQTPLADGYKIVYDELYYVVPESDPRPAYKLFPDNIVAYFWEGGPTITCDFYTPFEGPDPIMVDGEFIDLVMDINLTKDVSYTDDTTFGPPISAGGTFFLRFGEYDIHLNGYAFPLPTGVSVKTDRETDIFTAAESGYSVVKTIISEGDFHYLYSVSAGGNETEPVLDVTGEW